MRAIFLWHTVAPCQLVVTKEVVRVPFCLCLSFSAEKAQIMSLDSCIRFEQLRLGNVSRLVKYQI